MDFSKYNPAKIVLTFILTLGLLSGGRFAYQEFGVMGPLKKSLASTPVVKEAVIFSEKNQTVVQIELGKVSSLQASIREITKLLPMDDGYVLDIEDRRNEYLTRLWQENRFALEEAAVRGNLTEMQALLNENLAQAQLDSWLVEVDEQNLYLQLQAGDHYLYEIVTRHHYLNKQPIGKVETGRM
ncbi:MAG: hypothetical protein GX262_09745 [Clostridia bacterium]|jgi:hypothetical protein|nr:hypothetical protein [Clostridia bacterium]